MAYSFPADSDGIREELLALAPPEIQKAVMRQWFFEHYEDPIESTPYDSEEGGYLYIWGGPYNAREELDSEFFGTVPHEVVEELAEELEAIAWEWSGIPERDPSDDYLVSAIQANIDPRKTADADLATIGSLLTLETSSELELPMCRLLYVNVITCLEVYLCDTFMNRVLTDDELKKRLVHKSPEFKKDKITVSTIYEYFAALDDKLREYLFKTLWHNLPRVRAFYRNVLEMDFPDISTLQLAIEHRHDIVHRNGRTKDGNETIFKTQDVENLLREVETFIDTIESRLPRSPF